METKALDKQELLAMLSGIYEELEELESAVTATVNKEKEKLANEQIRAIQNCERKLSGAEVKVTVQECQKPFVHHYANMKLEIG